MSKKILLDMIQNRIVFYLDDYALYNILAKLR